MKNAKSLTNINRRHHSCLVAVWMETSLYAKTRKNSQSAQKHKNMETHITQPTTVNHRRVLLRLYHDLIMNYLLAQPTTLSHSFILDQQQGKCAHHEFAHWKKTAHISRHPDKWMSGCAGKPGSTLCWVLHFFGRQHTRKHAWIYLESRQLT